MGREKWRTDPDGFLECVDDETGEVLFRQAVKDREFDRGGRRRRSGPNSTRVRNQQQTHHWVMDSKGRKLWLPKGEVAPDPRVVYPFSEGVFDIILEGIRSGKNLAQMAAEVGIPRSVISNWMTRGKDAPERKKLYLEAKKDRADVVADKAVEIALDAKESNAVSTRLKYDALKWQAANDDNDTFGKKTNVKGEGIGAVTFQIVTGVPPALEENPPIPVEGKPIPDKEAG